VTVDRYSAQRSASIDPKSIFIASRRTIIDHRKRSNFLSIKPQIIARLKKGEQVYLQPESINLKQSAPFIK
jgi:hypothetical protein